MKTNYFPFSLLKVAKTSLRPVYSRLLLTLTFYLLSFSFFLTTAQVPQGFNYQAIARDGTGEIIADQSLPVKISIQTSLTGGTLIWEETHSVTTNQFGLMVLIVGDGTRTGGSATLFSDIDWGSEPLFLKTEVKYPAEEYVEMGTSQLWSVPYSMLAKDLEGPVDKLGVTGTTEDMEEALFEVKNKDGQTVFAVYNEGVRIYVDDGDEIKGAKGGFAIGGFDMGKSPGQDYLFVSSDSIRAYIYDDPLVKAAKGGFAIGGFNTTKGLTNDYLLISPDSARIYVDNAPSTKGAKGGFAIGGFDLSKGTDIQNYLNISHDSIRMYIDDTPTKAAKGGFAIGGFDMSKSGGNSSFFDVATDATKTILPSQKRILWYPIKNAFLTGKIIIEKPDSVGENSFASGFESKAIGDYSQAMGYKSIARGEYSTAIGKEAVADTNSFSFGNMSKALRDGSYAFGSGAYALGNMSFAFGSVGIDSLGAVTGNTKATGDHAYSFGLGSLASGRGSFAIGANDTASGNFSTSMGYKTRADGWYATAMGGYSKATYSFATASGFKSKASAVASFASGYITEASGDQSASFGYLTKASGNYSAAMGSSTKALGDFSFAVNKSTTASGQGASTFGSSTTASGQYAMATGQSSVASGWYSFAGGDGNTSSGTASFCTGKSNSSAGYYSLATGLGNTAKSFACFTIGSYCNDPGVNATTYVATDPLFIAGNGYLPFEPSRNALILYKNGNMTIAGDLTEDSDIRLKNVISDLDIVLPQILKIVPIIYEFKDTQSHPDGTHIGLSAQEIQQYFPELVSTDNKGFLSLNYSRLSAVLIKAVKEQQEIINRQKKRSDDLEKQIHDINLKLAQLINIKAGE